MDGYQEEGLTYAKLNPQTIYLTDGLRCRKTDSGYVLETMGSDEEWHAIGSGGGDATLELTSTGDSTDPSTFTADNSGIKQVDVNDVEMLRIWSNGAGSVDANLYIGDTLPAAFVGQNAQDNTAIGTAAMSSSTDPNNAPTGNTAIGSNALRSITTGQSNVAIGYAAGAGFLSDGVNNVIVGQGADILEPSGSQMVIVGGQTDSVGGVTYNAIGIGYNVEVRSDNLAAIGNGSVSEVIFGCPSTIQTSGLLISGRQYRIYNFATGDDFTNVGASSNETGEVFTATGTTPTDWSNGSDLRIMNPYGNAILNGKADALVFPDADPHVDGAAYWDSGVLVRSTG